MWSVSSHILCEERLCAYNKKHPVGCAIVLPSSLVWMRMCGRHLL